MRSQRGFDFIQFYKSDYLCKCPISSKSFLTFFSFTQDFSKWINHYFTETLNSLSPSWSPISNNFMSPSRPISPRRKWNWISLKLVFQPEVFGDIFRREITSSVSFRIALSDVDKCGSLIEWWSESMSLIPSRFHITLVAEKIISLKEFYTCRCRTGETLWPGVIKKRRVGQTWMFLPTSITGQGCSRIQERGLCLEQSHEICRLTKFLFILWNITSITS